MRRTLSLALAVSVTTPVVGCSDERAAPVPIAARPDTLAESASDSRLIRVNAVPIGRAVGSEAGAGEANLVVAIRDLAGVIDGAGGSGRSRLLLQGSQLFATRTGGCARCPLRVRRAVLLSARVTTRADGRYIPLTDLVLALEGRIEGPTGSGDIRILVGSCCWCILEPGSR